MAKEDEKPKHANVASDEPSVASKLADSASETTDDKTEPVDAAISDITKKESDDVLAAEDSKLKPTIQDLTPWYKRRGFLIPVIVAVFIFIYLLIIPASRYDVLGLFLKDHYTVNVVDSQTNDPVTAATIKLDGQTVTTNNHGTATLDVKLGNGKISISKAYYQTLTKEVTVPFHSKSAAVFQLDATGRQVPISLTNKVNGEPISNATISADGSTVKTDSIGKAIIVLPTNKSTASASLSGSGYNPATTTITVSDGALPSNIFSLTPAGSVYFLSNATGSVNVDKTNLDGTSTQIALAGTGSEDPNNTFLLPSPDWKYVALISKRASNEGVYIINTSNDQLIDVDTAAADFNFDGWTHSDYLVYTENLIGQAFGTPHTSLLKSYYPATTKLTTLDQSNGQTKGTSTVEEVYSNVNVLSNNTVLFLKDWSGTPASFTNLSTTLSSIMPNGNDKQMLKAFSYDTYNTFANATAAGPNSVYYYLNAVSGNTPVYFEYENGGVQLLDTGDANVAANAQNIGTSYLMSPSGQSTMWSSNVNGHTAINVGDSSGNNPKQIALLDNTYNVYGWYTDSYILISKNNNELYLMPAGGVSSSSQLIKISDYL